MDTDSFDLSRYEPLLAWGLSASPFEKLQGVVSGNVDATVVYGERISMSGKLTIDKPHFKTLGENGIDLSGSRFLVEPNLSISLDGKETVTPDKLDLSKFGASEARRLSREPKTSCKVPQCSVFIRQSPRIDSPGQDPLHANQYRQPWQPPCSCGVW